MNIKLILTLIDSDKKNMQYACFLHFDITHVMRYYGCHCGAEPCPLEETLQSIYSVFFACKTAALETDQELSSVQSSTYQIITFFFCFSSKFNSAFLLKYWLLSLHRYYIFQCKCHMRNTIKSVRRRKNDIPDKGIFTNALKNAE